MEQVQIQLLGQKIFSDVAKLNILINSSIKFFLRETKRRSDSRREEQQKAKKGVLSNSTETNGV